MFIEVTDASTINPRRELINVDYILAVVDYGYEGCQILMRDKIHYPRIRESYEEIWHPHRRL